MTCGELQLIYPLLQGLLTRDESFNAEQLMTGRDGSKVNLLPKRSSLRPPHATFNRCSPFRSDVIVFIMLHSHGLLRGVVSLLGVM